MWKIASLLGFTTLHTVAAHLSFTDFMAQFGKRYLSSKEQRWRQLTYISTLREIDQINARNLSWTAGVNQFSDLSWSEFQDQVGILRAPQNCSATKGNHVMSGRFIGENDSWDWRTQGVVTPVKNQGSCGSCWTFSSTGAIESAHAIRTKELISLSEQQLVDCAGAFNNFGCDGGLPSQAFQYLMHTEGIESDDKYPYTAKDGTCAYNKAGVAVSVVNEVNITMNDEKGLLDALKHVEPVSIAYQVASDFRNYVDGVYDSTVCKSGPQDVNHAVLAVGFDTDVDTGKPFYWVKNSWGADWGISGYFKIVRGKNMCGLATCASYPITN